MIKVKRAIAAVLTGIMLISACGCSNDQKKIEEICEVCDTFGKSVCYLDSQRILDNVEKLGGSEEENFINRLSMENMTYDEALVKQAIIETMSYEVLTDTAQVEKKEGSCDVAFYIVDYESALKDIVGYSDVFVDAVKARPKVNKYIVTLNLYKEDDRWYITSDSLSGLDQIYSFLDYEMVFCANTLDLFDKAQWMFAQDDTYTNTDMIELDLWFTAVPEEQLYYTVDKDGDQIYMSYKGICTDATYEAVFTADMNSGTQTDGILNAGVYTIKVFTERNNLVNSSTVIVETSEDALPDVPMSTDFYTIHDSSFAHIVDLGWWDYYDTMISENIYCIDTKTLGFSIQIKGAGPDLYYAYYYLGQNATVGSIELGDPICSDTIGTTKYKDGTVFYNLDYEASDLQPGTYLLYIAKDANSLDSAYITAVCTVIPQSSSEY